ncbi:MAG: diacylglycerol kinase [Bacteroidetes bacterium]|jgi:YegS/Rv2252/BmrU family lipid kinase|nr:diacylglycerol kinase [Bacteroidota bacterium]
MSRKLLFIINPKAGKKLGPSLLPLIEQKLKGKLDYEVSLWSNINEFNLISEKLFKEKFTDAIAVGGDGTVNIVAKTILGSNLKLGIIPAGSGNGLARSLGLPMNTSKALDKILEGKTHVIDSGTVNGNPFFCTSGVGFDAHIGNLFATSVKRGLKSYVKIIWKEFSSYKPKTYLLKYDNVTVEKTAFLITVGNAGQYGNDFYIAPGAKMNDGLFHVSVLKPFKFRQMFGLLIKVLNKKADKSKLIDTFTCKELTIKRNEKDVIHFDGEPAMSDETVVFKMNPMSLKAITGEKFRDA